MKKYLLFNFKSNDAVAGENLFILLLKRFLLYEKI